MWLLLAATHGILRGVNRHELGIVSEVITYLFLGVCTYRLTDVSFRDPGICLDQEIPGHETPERASQYRFCERCKVWQPPDGIHCPQCNVCVAGYDHHCVWMGTCIGKRNYRQFVKFNMTVSTCVGRVLEFMLRFSKKHCIFTWININFCGCQYYFSLLSPVADVCNVWFLLGSNDWPVGIEKTYIVSRATRCNRTFTESHPF